MHVQPPYPMYWILLGAVLLAGLAAAGYRRRVIRKELTSSQAFQYFLLRFFAIILLAFMLARPYVRVGVEEDVRRKLPVFVDTSASFGIADVPDGKGRPPATRLAAAGKSLGKILKPLEKRFEVEVYGFDTRLHEQPPEVEPGQALDMLDTGGGETDIALPLKELAKMNSSDAVPPAGAILLTDGRHTAGKRRAVFDALDELAAATRVYVLPFGGEDYRNLALRDIRSTKIAALNTRVKVSGTLEVHGFPKGAKIVVGVYRENEPSPLQEQVFIVKTGGKKQSSFQFSFEFLPASAGRTKYRVAAAVKPVADKSDEPAGGGTGRNSEITKTDNSCTFVVDSRARPLRVLYMEGTMYRREDEDPPVEKWEHQFLEQALTEGLLDKDGNMLDVEVKVLFRDNDDGAVTRFNSGSSKKVEWVRQWESEPGKGFPTSREELYKYDVIISSDIDIDFFTKDQLEWTRDFVRDEGGGFVMIGGWTAFGPGGYDESILDAMLPVDMLGMEDEYVEEENCLKWSFPPNALKHPIMKLDDDPERNRQIWEGMPYFHGFNRVQRAKPAATVLACHPDIDRYGNVDGQPAPIVAVQQYGLGRAMAFCTDTTAGWGRNFETKFGPNTEENELTGHYDNSYFRKFWRNAIHWLAQERIRRPSQKVIHKLPAGQAELGKPFQVRVLVRNKDFRPAQAAKVHTTLITPDGDSINLELHEDLESGKGIYTALFTPKIRGFHELKTSAELDGKELGNDTDGFFAIPAVREFRRPEVDSALLEEIATRTGGLVQASESIAGLPDIIEKDRRRNLRTREKEIWDHPVFFLAIASLLCVEWFLRKRRALP